MVTPVDGVARFGPVDEPVDDPDEVVTVDGARAPDRTRSVVAGGLRIDVKEWGDPFDPPLLLAHGGLDFARTYDVFAPLLAAGGWRVVAWDQRGHGDSEHAALYTWDADARDAMAVLNSTTERAVPVVGHSKGGALMMHLAEVAPHRISRVANLDGLPSIRPVPDLPDHDRVTMLADETDRWLSFRRRSPGHQRRPGTLPELAERRGRMNPRLAPNWLRYLVTVGARRDADGWRWKLDPGLRPGGFGPWRPEWMLQRMKGLSQPLLGVLGLELEEMGWGTRPADVEPYLPQVADFVVLEDTGHFVHIERPERISALVLDFVGPPT